MLIALLLAATATAAPLDPASAQGSGWTLGRSQARLSLLRESAVGLSDRVDLSSNLTLSALGYPTLGVAIGVLDRGDTALSLDARGFARWDYTRRALYLRGAELGGTGSWRIDGGWVDLGVHVDAFPRSGSYFLYDLADRGPWSLPLTGTRAWCRDRDTLRLSGRLDPVNLLRAPPDSATDGDRLDGLSLGLSWTHSWRRAQLLLGAELIYADRGASSSVFDTLSWQLSEHIEGWIWPTLDLRWLL